MGTLPHLPAAHTHPPGWVWAAAAITVLAPFAAAAGITAGCLLDRTPTTWPTHTMPAPTADQPRDEDP